MKTRPALTTYLGNLLGQNDVAVFVDIVAVAFLGERKHEKLGWTSRSYA